MTAITELGYVRFGVSSLEEWRAFATDLVGLEIGDDSEPGRLYLRSDLWHHRVALEEDGSDDLIGMGLRVAGPAEFAAMQAHLAELGVPYEVKHIHHIMFQVDHLDDVLLAHGLVCKSQYPITVPLGRHANDQTFSFYFRGPSGFQVEIGWGGRPSTHQSEYYTRDTYRGER